MATKTPAREAFGKAVQKARVRAGLTPAEVDEHMGWYAGKASRVEAGTRKAVRAEVDELAKLFKASDATRATLHALAEPARSRVRAAHVADFAQSYVTMEGAAVEIDYYDALLIPAVAQTDAYALAIVGVGGLPDVAQAVADRLARQEMLSGPDAPNLRIALGEGVCQQEVGGRAALREQLAHLIEIGQLPTVEVRIVPFTFGAHRALGVGFTRLRLDEPEMVRVYSEGFTHATYIHEARETDVYEREFERLWSAIPGAEESATILRRHIDRLATED